MVSFLFKSDLSQLLLPQFISFFGVNNMSLTLEKVVENTTLEKVVENTTLEKVVENTDALNQGSSVGDSQSTSESFIESQILLEFDKMAEADKENFLIEPFSEKKFSGKMRENLVTNKASVPYHLAEKLSQRLEFELENIAKKSKKETKCYIWLRNQKDGKSYAGYTGEVAGKNFLHISITNPYNPQFLLKVVKINVSDELYKCIRGEVDPFVLGQMKTGKFSRVKRKTDAEKMDKTINKANKGYIWLNNPKNGMIYSLDTGEEAKDKFLHISIPFPENQSMSKIVQMNVSDELYTVICYQVDQLIADNLKAGKLSVVTPKKK